MSLREGIKQIFKKYGVTMSAIFLAAGVTIGAVLRTMTRALKKLGKDLGNGLKTLEAKATSPLPGLIGAIVSFIFKAAGSVIGFLAEHTWLLTWKPFSRTNILKFSFWHRYIDKWNFLPDSLMCRFIVKI